MLEIQRRRNKYPLLCVAEGTIFFRLFLFLVTGILVPVNCRSLAIVVVPLLMIVFAFFRCYHRLMSVSVALFLFAVGIYTSSRPIPPLPPSGDYTLRVLTSPKPVRDHYTCEAEITDLASRPIILLHVADDSLICSSYLHVSHLKPYMTRHADYALYLERHRISGIAYVASGQIRQLDHTPALSYRLRHKVIGYYRRCGIDGERLAVLSALTLGERSLLTERTNAAFRTAGVAHVLVVSGMHVGFLFLLVLFAYRHSRYKMQVVLIGMALIWFYAWFTGFSVSVRRAAFMFTVMLLARSSGGEYNPIGSLFLSAFIIVLFNPMAIYDASFQMSYMAVLSILLFMPLFRVSGRNIVLQNVALTVSAQILLTPLIIYLFGNFPMWFMLSNLFIALLAPLVFILAPVAFLPFCSWTLWMMCGIVSFISALPWSQLQVSISSRMLIVSYVLLFLLYDLIASRATARSVITFLVAVILSSLMLAFT